VPALQQAKNYLLRERPAGRFERVLTINTPIVPQSKTSYSAAAH